MSIYAEREWIARLQACAKEGGKILAEHSRNVVLPPPTAPPLRPRRKGFTPDGARFDLIVTKGKSS